MKRNVFVRFRVSHFSSWVLALFLTLVACEPENGLENTVDDEEEEVIDLSGAVDLGLSVRWAECNVGAESPGEYGGYYAWGETKEKDNYLPSTYLYSDVNIGSDISGTDYDAAHVLLGNGWRMPTKEEFNELCEECDWQWTTENGINGYEVIGPNGNSIFLPAAGYRYGTTVDYFGMRGTYGYYWSGTKLNTNNAYNLHFSSTKILGVGENGHNPYDGHTIRPVVSKGSASQKYILQLKERNYSVSYKANEIDVELQANVDFECKIIDASWVRERQLDSRALTIHNLVFGIVENSSHNIREAQIVFYNTRYALSDTLTLVQEGNPDTSSIEAVDLGLSVKWASCNVGATSPEEYGGYYAWGEIGEKEVYSESAYLYYNNNSYDNLGSDICGTEYDVAHVEWGGNWRMPTRDEMRELYNNCSWEWTSINGISGQKVTGPNGNSIFLPAAGYRENNTCYYPETFGYYWASSLNTNSSDRAYCLGFRDGARMTSSASRYGGQPIRPVWGDESVSQQQFIRILTKYYNVSYKANVIEVKVDSNVKFEYSILDASWVKEGEVVARVTSTHNIVFDVDENTSRNIREAQIVFYNTEYALSDTLTLVQEGNPDASSIEAVDLGLSVKWASCNVGATSPEEYGDYFSWGRNQKSGYYDDSNSITYGMSIIELKSRGIIDANDNLTAAYDAATVNLGDNWRIPTLDEMNELSDECTWEWTKMNSVNGYKVTGPNSNSIFLPAAGYRSYMSLNEVGTHGHYWSATPYYGSSGSAYCLYFRSSPNKIWGWDLHNRSYGCPVRPVSE